MAFNAEKLDIPRLLIVRPTIWDDERGLFHEIFKRSDMEGLSISMDLSRHSAFGTIKQQRRYR